MVVYNYCYLMICLWQVGYVDDGVVVVGYGVNVCLDLMGVLKGEEKLFFGFIFGFNY